MDWRSATHIEATKYDLPGEWLKIEYFEALNILFRIENSLRVFVYIVLKNEMKEKWASLSITSDDEETSTINAIAKKRIAQDKNYAYLGYIINSPLLHLTSGELIRIITSENYWKFFKQYFLSTKEVIKTKLDEINNVRNAVAHFRPIRKGDVDLIKQNAIHTLSKIEKTLIDFINCNDIVPTNTDESWYKELVVLRTNELSISFRQSKNEEWIQLFLHLHSPILRYSEYSGWVNITMFNLKTNSVLANFPELTKHALAITEEVPTYYDSGKLTRETKIRKSLLFTFSKKSLAANHISIKNSLEDLFTQISTEITLIKEDNLARGKLIEVTNGTLDIPDEGKYTILEKHGLRTEIGDDTPVEFWGPLTSTGVNFISSTESYPWIPVSISDDYLPF